MPEESHSNGMSESGLTFNSDARPTGFRQDALAHFHDREYRHAYIDEFLNTSIASQIRALREERGWTQAELARRAATGQSRISELENVNYESWTVNSLRTLAEAFDVTLAVCFKSFSERIGEIERFSRSAISVPSYTDDLFLSVGAKSPPTLADTSPLVPLISRLAHVFAQFKSAPTPTGGDEIREGAAELLEMVDQMYTKTSRQYREFAEWASGLLMNVVVTAQARIMSKEQEEQAIARLEEIEAEKRAIREAAQRESEAREQAKQQEIERIQVEHEQSVAAMHQAAERIAQGIAAAVQSVMEAIAAEREAIHQVATSFAAAAAAATAMAESYDPASLSNTLHGIEQNLLGVEHRMEELVAA